MKKESKTVEWMKCHKKELIIVGVTAGVVLVVVIKKRETIKAIYKAIRNSMAISKRDALCIQTVSPVENREIADIIDSGIVVGSKIPHCVSEHIRNLPKNKTASLEKMMTAGEHGFVLCPGQTWVKAYSTGNYVA